MTSHPNFVFSILKLSPEIPVLLFPTQTPQTSNILPPPRLSPQHLIRVRHGEVVIIMSLRHVGSHLCPSFQQWLGPHCQLQKPILVSASPDNSWHQQFRNRLWDEDLLAGSSARGVSSGPTGVGGKDRRITQELQYNHNTVLCQPNAGMSFWGVLFRDKELLIVQPFINQSLAVGCLWTGIWGWK